MNKGLLRLGRMVRLNMLDPHHPLSLHMRMMRVNPLEPQVVGQSEIRRS